MLKAYEPSGNILFEEKQKFPKWVLTMILMVVLSSFLIILGSLLALGNQSKPDKVDMLIVFLLIIPMESIMIYLFYITRFEKIVTSNGLYFRWPPLQKKYRVIETNEIAIVEKRKSPFKYGSGWVPGYGKVYNLSKEGLQFHLASGKKYFFGSGEVEQFQKAIEQKTTKTPFA